MIVEIKQFQRPNTTILTPTSMLKQSQYQKLVLVSATTMSRAFCDVQQSEEGSVGIPIVCFPLDSKLQVFYTDASLSFLHPLFPFLATQGAAPSSGLPPDIILSHILLLPRYATRRLWKFALRRFSNDAMTRIY